MLCKTFYLSYFLVITLGLNLQVSAESSIESVTPWISQINYATNSKTANCQDCNGYNKWVEIYNPGSTALDLAGYKTSTGLKNQQPISGLIIPAGGVGYLESNLNKQNDLSVNNKTKATVGSVGSTESGYTVSLIDPNGKVISSRKGQIDQTKGGLAAVVFCSREDSGKLSQTDYQTLSNGTQLKASLNQTPAQKKECKQESSPILPVTPVSKPETINNATINNETQPKLAKEAVDEKVVESGAIQIKETNTQKADSTVKKPVAETKPITKIVTTNQTQIQTEVVKEAAKEFADTPIQEIAKAKVIDPKPVLQTETKPNLAINSIQPNIIDKKLGVETNLQLQPNNQTVANNQPRTQPEKVANSNLEKTPEASLVKQANWQPVEPEIKKVVEDKAGNKVVPEIVPIKILQSKVSETNSAKIKDVKTVELVQPAIQPIVQSNQPTIVKQDVSEIKPQITDSKIVDNTIAKSPTTQALSQQVNNTKINTNNSNQPLVKTNIQTTEAKILPVAQNLVQPITDTKINNSNNQVVEMQIPNIQKIQPVIQPPKLNPKIQLQNQPELKSIEVANKLPTNIIELNTKPTLGELVKKYFESKEIKKPTNPTENKPTEKTKITENKLTPQNQPFQQSPAQKFQNSQNTPNFQNINVQTNQTINQAKPIKQNQVEILVKPTFDYAKEIATLKTPQKVIANTPIAATEIPKEQNKLLPIQTNIGLLSMLTILAYLINQFQRFRFGTVVSLSKLMNLSKK